MLITKLVTLLVSLPRKLQKLKQVGFVGGMESEVITRFRAGFEVVLNLLTHLSKFK